MSKKIPVEKADYGRVLLTETLPYEVPIFFSNERLYHFSKVDLTNAPPLVKRIFKDPFEYTVAFEYKIRQGEDKLRTLSVIHPAWQLSFPDFYRDYESLIVSLCGKSEFSLRYPSRVASHFFEKEFDSDHHALKSNSVDEEPDDFKVDSKYAGSFFYYARYNQLYKFVDSPEFLGLEQRFPYLIKFDVKRCFSSIYTHSISWAVKGKTFAKLKENRRHSFDQQFDRLMQVSNYAETNGIVIGPEVSRIFAEIILQQIDLNIADRVRAELQITDEDFALRRYLDDYFLFCRNKGTATKIFNAVQAELQDYKLYVNESKTQEFTVPFATPQTIAKSDVREVLASSILRLLEDARKLCAEDDEAGRPLREERQIRIPFKFATTIIRDLKIAVKRSGTSFNVVTGYALSAITKCIFRLEKASRSKGFRPGDLELLQNILIATMEVAFFLYSMDFRVRTTYLISQFMLIVAKIGKTDPELHGLVTSRLLKGTDTVLQFLSPEECGGIEVLNLLIAMKSVAPGHLLGAERLKDLTRNGPAPQQASAPHAHLNYFDFVSLLHYIGSSPAHETLRLELEAEIVARFENAPKDIRNHTELTLLLFDMVSCPYIAETAKEAIIAEYAVRANNQQPKIEDTRRALNYINKHLSFCDWRGDLDLEKLLIRKQLNPGY